MISSTEKVIKNGDINTVQSEMINNGTLYPASHDSLTNLVLTRSESCIDSEESVIMDPNEVSEEYLINVNVKRVPKKDFHLEVRGLRDIKHHYKDIIVLMNVSHTSLDQIIQDFVLKV